MTEDPDHLELRRARPAPQALRKVALLLDTRGIVALWRTSHSLVLRVEITGLRKNIADFIRDTLVAGYVIPQTGGRDYKFSIAAVKAAQILRLLKPYSKWQKNQINISCEYERLKEANRSLGSDTGAQEDLYAIKLVTLMKKYNSETFRRQREYHARKEPTK